MNEDRFQRLSEYLDGELAEAEASALRAEVEADPELAALLAELRGVKAAAGALAEREPDRDLWPAIAARIESGRVTDLATKRRARRSLTFSIPQFAAAMIATLLLGSGALWFASSIGQFAGSSSAGNAVAESGGPTTESRLEQGVPIRLVENASTRNPSLKSDLAIASLEARLAEERDNLDSTTIRIIEESLATIDRAIASATAALESDPGNVWLNRHLADSKSRKVRLLEKAAALSAVRT